MRKLAFLLCALLIASVAVAADQIIRWNEKMVGAGHPTLSDTLNRGFLIDHSADGTHKDNVLVPLKLKITGASPATDNTAPMYDNATGLFRWGTVVTTPTTTLPWDNITGTSNIAGDNTGRIQGYSFGSASFTDNGNFGNITGDNTGRIQGYSFGSASFTDNGYFRSVTGNGTGNISSYDNATFTGTVSSPKIGSASYTDNGYFKYITGDNTGRVQGFSIGSASYTDNGYFGDVVTKGPWVDVRAFGAVGDNTTDDTAAIQAAVDTGKPVYFPQGVYVVSTVNVSGHYRIFMGAGGAMTYYSGTTPQNSTLRATGSGPVLNVQGHNNSFFNMNFDGNFTADNVVQIDNYSTKNLFHMCSFTRTTGGGTGHLVDINSAPGVIQNDFNTFEFCHFRQDFANAADNCDRGISNVGSNTQKQKILSSYFSNCQNGVYVYGGTVDIIDSQFESCSYAGITLYGENHGRIEGNYTETSGMYFLRMVDAASSGDSTLILRNNWINTNAYIVLYDYQSIISTGNMYKGNVSVNSSSVVNRHVTSIGDFFTNGATITGALANNVTLINTTIDNVLYGENSSGFLLWNPGTIADNAISSTYISVPGAALGDYVEPHFPKVIAAGVMISGAVVATDNVQVTIFNRSGGNVSPGQDYLRVIVRKNKVF